MIVRIERTIDSIAIVTAMVLNKSGISKNKSEMATINKKLTIPII